MTTHETLFSGLTRLPGWAKFLILITVDLLVSAVLIVSAVSFVSLVRPVSAEHAQLLYLIAPPLVVACLFSLRGYRAVTRFLSFSQLSRLVGAVALAGVTLAAIVALQQLPKSLHVALALFVAMSMCAHAGLRILAMSVLRPAWMGRDRKPVLIYGAGRAGTQLAAALASSPKYRPVGFVDDDPALQKRAVLGLQVFSRNCLPKLKEQDRFEQVFVALPSQSRAVRKGILEALEQLAVRVKVVPGLDELESTSNLIDDIRDVQVEDLLGRDPVKPDEKLMDAFIRDQVVLITGGGGSIGSELARQVMRRHARKLVLLDVSEHALYQIERELRALQKCNGCGAVELVPVLGSVLDRRLVRRTIAEHKIETIYHAAAYKHVPLVEANALPGIQNNIFGTLVVCDEAGKAGVNHFVLVSTDKAVRPTSVMGATKRVAELVVQSKAERYPDMACAIVRFGNVLASSGSVVPLFQEQLRAGGPITVTHPDVTRYFMTIPEAAQLVIQAGAMGQHGDVFLLDMGEPVKIDDLARRMVHLAGLHVCSASNPQGDIEISYTGLRRGEKLYEELLIDDQAVATRHRRIFASPEPRVPGSELGLFLRRCREAIKIGNGINVIDQLMRLGQQQAYGNKINKNIVGELANTERGKKQKSESSSTVALSDSRPFSIAQCSHS